MTVICAPQAFNEEDLYIDLRSISEPSLFLKCEGFNFAGSVKLKTAREMVEAAEQDGTLRPGAVLIESSSGNLGVALSMIAASKGYRFLCVTDPRCNLSSRRLMEALGAPVHTLTEPDPPGGLLGRRAARGRGGRPWRRGAPRRAPSPSPIPRGASSAPGRTTSGRCAPPMTGMCGSTSTATPAPGWPTTARRHRPSPARSPVWTCCSSGPEPPGP